MQDSNYLPVQGIYCGIFETYNQPCPIFVIELWFPLTIKNQPQPTWKFSSLGRVRSIDRISICNTGTVFKKGKILKGGFNGQGKYGYCYHALYVLGKNTIIYAHTLVTRLTPNPKNRTVRDHINRVSTDNRFFNLRWVTYKENSQNSERPKGIICKNVKLTENQVLEIRKRYAAGCISIRKLAKDYPVTHGIIWAILTRRRWKHI